MSAAETVVVVLTPAGRGAIATVLVAGVDAERFVEMHFRSATQISLLTAEPSRILFGRWKNVSGEEIVVARRAVGRVEIHCHGGSVAVEAIIADLTGSGCRRETWTDWLKASSTNQLQAAAQAALAAATTARTAMILLDQYHGALETALMGIVKNLAATDENCSQDASRQIARLLQLAPVGLHLTRPWRVVLAGAPNVGKSSLINALVGYERSIVFDTPGTTRDVVTAYTAFDGWPVELSDTAGLRTAGDALESAGIELARQAVAAADLLLKVEDVSSEPGGDNSVWDALTAERVLHVSNKCDLSHRRAPVGLLVSARTGEGLAALQAAIAAQLVPRAPQSGEAVPFQQDQLEALRAAEEASKAGDYGIAQQALSRLGESPVRQ